MSAAGRARGPGGFPDRSEVLQRRDDAGGDAGGDAGDDAGDDVEMEVDDSADLAKIAQDRQWHSLRHMPFVYVGGSFELDGYPFTRTEERMASCRTCSHTFNMYAYHKRALTDHGRACTRKEVRRTDAAASRDEWSGTLECKVQFGGENEDLVQCTFTKKVLAGGVLRGPCVRAPRKDPQFDSLNRIVISHTGSIS